MKHQILSLALSLGLAHSLVAQVNTSPLSLEQCRAMARKHNHAIQREALSIDLARETKKEALTNYFPKLSADAFYFRTNKPMIEESFSLALPAPLPSPPPINVSLLDRGFVSRISALQPLFAGGRIITGNKLARLGVEVAELRYLKSQDELDAQTDKYYMQIVELEAERQTLQAMDSLVGQVRRDVEVAVKAGITSPNDLLRVQLRQDELASAQLRLEHGISTLRLLLAQHTGVSSASLILEPISTSPSSPLDIYVDASMAVEGRVERQLLDKAVEAKRLEQTMELGKLLPSLGVGGSYSYSKLISDGRSNALVYASLSVPLSDWWSGSHTLRRKKLERKQAELERSDAKEKMKIQIERAYMDVEEAYKQSILTEKSTKYAEEHLRMLREGYRSGLKTIADLLEAQALLQESQVKALKSRSTYQLQRLSYERLTRLPNR